MKKVKILFLIISLFSCITALAQDIDIVPYLKMIENGERDAVLQKLPKLIEENPESPNLTFLQAVLTENGQQAVVLYQKIINDYPGTRYADAAIFRVYSYYYALGLYQTAKTYLEKLKREYPQSSYIKIADQNIPSKDEPLKNDEPVTTNKKIEDEIKSDSKNYKFTIQAGAFSSSKNAEQLKNEFQSAGLYSFINEKEVAGTIFHVVFVGRYESKLEADDSLPVINKQFGIEGRAVELQFK